MRAVVRAATRRATTSATAAVVRPTSAVWQKSYAVRAMTMTMTNDKAWKCDTETDDTRGVVGCAHFIQFRCVGGSARREQRE